LNGVMSAGIWRDIAKQARAAVTRKASDRICGKRLKVMIPTLLPSLERHGRLKLDQAGRALVLGVSAAPIDRLLDVAALSLAKWIC
jgi:hypothetical protein